MVTMVVLLSVRRMRHEVQGLRASVSSIDLKWFQPNTVLSPFCFAITDLEKQHGCRCCPSSIKCAVVSGRLTGLERRNLLISSR